MPSSTLNPRDATTMIERGKAILDNSCLVSKSTVISNFKFSAVTAANSPTFQQGPCPVWFLHHILYIFFKTCAPNMKLIQPRFLLPGQSVIRAFPPTSRIDDLIYCTTFPTRRIQATNSFPWVSRGDPMLCWASTTFGLIRSPSHLRSDKPQATFFRLRRPTPG